MTRGIYVCIVLGALCVQPFIENDGEIQTGDQPPAARATSPDRGSRGQTGALSNQVELPSTGPLPGIAEPAKRVELLAPVDGILAKINVLEGQYVKAGDVLAQFDDKLAQATVRVARAAAGKADIELAEVDLRLAEAELQRLLNVTDRRALAEVEIDRAQSAVDRAKATVNRAKQLNKQAIHTLEVEQERLQQRYLKAPFDGVVIRISTQQGSSLVRSTPIITIANLERLRVELFASLAHFDTLTVGQNYQLKASAPVSRSINARLISREPVIDPATKTFRCVFEIENTASRLPAGFTVLFSGQRAAEEIAFHLPSRHR